MDEESIARADSSAREAVQNWIEHRGQPMHDRLTWVAWAMLPPWLLMAALVPAVAALCRRFPLSGDRWRALSVHGVVSLVFPVVHLGGLALLHSIAGDLTPLGPRIAGLLGFHYLFDVLDYWAIAGVLFLIAARRSVTVHHPNGPDPRTSRLVIRDAGGVHVVPVDAIDWIEARNYYARVHAGDRRHLVRQSLNSRRPGWTRRILPGCIAPPSSASAALRPCEWRMAGRWSCSGARLSSRRAGRGGRRSRRSAKTGARPVKA